MTDPLHEFAATLVDDLRVAETVRERDANDTGERLSLEDLIHEQEETMKSGHPITCRCPVCRNLGR